MTVFIGDDRRPQPAAAHRRSGDGVSISSAGSPVQEAPPPTSPVDAGSPAASGSVEVVDLRTVEVVDYPAALGTPEVPSPPNRHTPPITGRVSVTLWHRYGRLALLAEQVRAAVLDVPELGPVLDQVSDLYDEARRMVAVSR